MRGPAALGEVFLKGGNGVIVGWVTRVAWKKKDHTTRRSSVTRRVRERLPYRRVKCAIMYHSSYPMIYAPHFNGKYILSCKSSLWVILVILGSCVSCHNQEAVSWGRRNCQNFTPIISDHSVSPQAISTITNSSYWTNTFLYLHLTGTVLGVIIIFNRGAKWLGFCGNIPKTIMGIYVVWLTIDIVNWPFFLTKIIHWSLFPHLWVIPYLRFWSWDFAFSHRLNANGTCRPKILRP